MGSDKKAKFVQPHAASHIRDADARRVCTLHGMAAAQQKVVALQQLRASLDTVIRELEGQRRWEHIVHRAKAVTLFTKATCDAFIGIAAALSKVVLPDTVSKKAEYIEKLYGTATPVAEALGNAIAGAKQDWVKTGATVAKEGVGLVTKNKAHEVLTKTTVVKVEIIKGALNGDTEGVVKSAAEYSADLHATLADIIKWKKTEAFIKIAKSGFVYNEALGKAFEELVDNDLDTSLRYLSQRNNIAAQARRLSQKIEELESLLLSCEVELREMEEPLSRRLG